MTERPWPLVSLGVTQVTGERTLVERPPPGLARGKHQTSALVVVGLAALLVLLALGYYAFRLRKRSRP